jgi:hypothetical protein
MAAPAKLITIYGLLGKTEASYGVGGSLAAATDGLLAEELPKFTPGYANDGLRAAPPSNLGYQPKVAPSGKFVDPFPFKHAPKLPGNAYSASNFWTAHNPLRWCGFDGAVTTTGGLEKWVYTPTPGPTGYASGVMSGYARGELWPITGVLGDFTWGFKGPEVPVFDFTFKGLLGNYTDVAVPSITYPFNGQNALKSVNVALSLFGVTQVAVREATLKLGRTLQPRLDVMTSGHLGFVPLRRTPTLEVLVETPAIATQDFYAAWEAAQNGAWSLGINQGTQYNRYKFSGSAAQLMSAPKLEDDGAIALTRLTLQLVPTLLTNNDDLTITTD